MTFDLEKFKAQSELHVDFAELDEMYEGLYAKLKRAYMLPYATYMKLWHDTGPEDETDYERAIRRLSVHVIDWNLPNLTTGDVLTLPSKDKDVLRGMLTEWVTYMGACMVKDYTDSLGKMGKALSDGEESSEDTSENPSPSDQDSQDIDDFLTTTGI